MESNAADSHLGSNIFANIERLPELWNAPQIWSNFGSDLMFHYVRLQPGLDSAATTGIISDFLLGLGFPADHWEVVMQPLRDIHFTPDLQNEMSIVDDILGTAKPLRQRSDILIFSAVAVLALLIAGLNFMNMQSVQLLKRGREIGVRRLSGASRPALVGQHLCESALMACLALALSLPLCELLMPPFAAALGMPLEGLPGWSPASLLILTGLALVLGLGASALPALSAARLEPAAALRGEILKGRSAGQFRAALIVLQFAISIGLIIGGFIVKNQIDYALSKPLGFVPANVVTVDLPNNDARRAFETMRSELLAHPGVVSVSAGTTIPTRSLSDGFGLTRVGESPDEGIGTRLVSVSEDYFETLGMRMAAGRALSEDFPTDRKPPLSAERTTAQGGIVLNETAARLAGWRSPQEAIGARYYVDVQPQGWRNEFTVVGVVEDAHYGSIRQAVEPLTYVFYENYSANVMTVKLNGAETAGALMEIDRLWRELVPGIPLQRAFLYTTWSSLYAGETRTFALFIALSILAVLIACSGLYALAAYNTERRTKEIGVRKVVGGSVWSIVVLLTQDFSRLVLLANLIAWPLAWYAMQRWLENFAYRIDLTPVIFVGSGLIAFCIAWVTVGGTAAKAANAKPVLALRYE